MSNLSKHELTLFARSELGLPALAGGTVYFVDPTSGIGGAGNDGLSPESPMLTITQAYNKCTTGKNDIVCYIGGATSLTESAIVWSKSYTHLIGVCADTRVAQRARIFLTAASVTPIFFHVSGTGCKFKNFYIFHGVASTASLICFQVSGGRCSFENVHFAGIGHATGQGDEAAARSLKVTGDENTFRNCTIGVDTTVRSAANAELELSSQATRNSFEECLFLSITDAATHLFVSIPALGLDRWVRFKDCEFYNSILGGGTQMTVAMSVNASPGGQVYLVNPNMDEAGVAAWADAFTNVRVTNLAGSSTTGLMPVGS